jgi:hypothetical protein
MCGLLNKSSRRWSENKTDVRDSLVIEIRHNLFDILIVIIGISEWLKPQNRWNTTLKTEKQIKTLNSGDDFPSINELPLYIHFYFPLSPILSQDLPFSNMTGVL